MMPVALDGLNGFDITLGYTSFGTWDLVPGAILPFGTQSQKRQLVPAGLRHLVPGVYTRQLVPGVFSFSIHFVIHGSPVFLMPQCGG